MLGFLDRLTYWETLSDLVSHSVVNPVQSNVWVPPVEHGDLHADEALAHAGGLLFNIPSLSVGHRGEERRAVALRLYPVDHAGVQTVGHTVGEPRALDSRVSKSTVRLGETLLKYRGWNSSSV